MAREVVIEGRVGERCRVRASGGGGLGREEAMRVIAGLAWSPLAEQQLRGLVFAIGIDAARLDRAGLQRQLVELLVRGQLAVDREGPARESGQRGRSEVEVRREDADAPMVTTEWIGIELVDADGIAVPWEPYVVELPDGRQVRGKLGVDGKAVVRGIPGGACKIGFPQRGARMWRPAQ